MGRELGITRHDFRRLNADVRQHAARDKRSRQASHAKKLRRSTFCEVYLATFSPRLAAEAAGYRPEHGSRLLRQQAVQDELDRRLDQLAQHVTPQWIEVRLAQLSTYTGPGWSHSAQVQACAVLAKIKGMLADRHQVHGKSEVTVRHVREDAPRGTGG